MSMPANFVLRCSSCPGSAKAQYLTVSSCIVWDPFFMSAFFTNQQSHQKKKCTPCTPKQCHKAPQKVPKATPASIFKGIRHHLGQTATQLLSYSSLTKPKNVWPAIDRVVKRDNIGICTRSMHRPPITLVSKVSAKYFCHRVIFQRSRKCLERNTKRQEKHRCYTFSTHPIHQHLMDRVSMEVQKFDSYRLSNR